MISLLTAQSLVTTTLLVIAYIISVTIIGYIQAWVAKKCGDDTAQSLGFLSLNPLIHMDPWGFFLLFLTGLGWQRPTPFNPNNIDSPHQDLKLVAMYGTGPLANIVLAVIACLCGLIFFGGYEPLLRLVPNLFTHGATSLKKATHIYADRSSLYILGALLCAHIAVMNIFLSGMNTIFEGFRYILALGIKKNYPYVEWLQYSGVAITAIILFLFVNRIRYYTLIAVLLIITALARLLGL